MFGVWEAGTAHLNAKHLRVATDEADRMCLVSLTQEQARPDLG